LFVLINLCIFVFSFMFFRIYSIEKKPKRKNQKHLPPFEAAVGCKQLPFQVAVAARQLAATRTRPAATVANLPAFATAVGFYRQMPRRYDPTALSNGGTIPTVV
jgi:amino acid transporter